MFAWIYGPLCCIDYSMGTHIYNHGGQRVRCFARQPQRICVLSRHSLAPPEESGSRHKRTTSQVHTILYLCGQKETRRDEIHKKNILAQMEICGVGTCNMRGLSPERGEGTQPSQHVVQRPPPSVTCCWCSTNACYDAINMERACCVLLFCSARESAAARANRAG